MGHYASEMDDGYNSHDPEVQTGYDHEQTIIDFYDDQNPGTGTSCPRCGAKIKWHWMNVDDLLLHIDWHKNLAQAIETGRVDPGYRL